MLEELEMAYDSWRIYMPKGDQFGPGFTAKQPN